jgi:hypothetical protein
MAMVTTISNKSPPQIRDFRNRGLDAVILIMGLEVVPEPAIISVLHITIPVFSAKLPTTFASRGLCYILPA